VRWTLGQTGHGWRSGLDGGCSNAFEWAFLRLQQGYGQGQGAAASSPAIEIRRFAYGQLSSIMLPCSIIGLGYGFEKASGNLFREHVASRCNRGDEPSVPIFSKRVWGLEIRRFSDLETRGIVKTRLCCFCRGTEKACALGSAERGRLFVKRGGGSDIC
jgi:hypothetical protein